MPTDFRALCAELVKDFDDLRASSEGVTGFHQNGDVAPWDELSESGEYPWLSAFDRARRELAQTEPEGLTDEELDALERQHWEPTGVVSGALQKEEVFNYRTYARAVEAAVLARHPTPQPPADGEVAQVAVELQELAESCDTLAMARVQRLLTRAAELLHRYASPACYVVSPSPEAIDALRAAGPGRIELLPGDAQIIEPAES